MRDVSTRIRRGTLKRLDEAFQGFFGRVKKGGAPGFPRIKGRHFPDGISIVSGVKAGDGNLCVPAFGEMAIRRKGGNPCPEGRPVPAVLWHRSGRWQAIACHAAEVGEPAGNGHATGPDRDAGQVPDSDGEMHEMPVPGRLAAKGRRLQRRTVRRKKASRRREKPKRHHAKVVRKIANRRHDWHHHASRDLAAKAGTVAVEGLNVKGMTKGAKGTVEEPAATSRRRRDSTASSSTRDGRRSAG